jgi:CheY-like chemotaxis protein
MRQAISKQVEVILDLDAALDPVRIDASQFEATLLNLISNARDAMPSGGRVVISTRNANLLSDAAQGRCVAPGAYVQISVADTGFGMDRATAAMAFEPFFTTKDVGKGTGLGLSQVYGFAKQAGGSARIDTMLGEGTTIELLLPRSVAPEERTLSPRLEAMPLRPATQGEVVLVVEDEPMVLELAVECLRDLGYKTLAADTAATALERLRSTERIDILFSDVVMPGGMNGVQLAVVARTLRDGLKVVLTSGYTASALAQDHEMPVGTPLLSKPYAREELAQTLRSVLEAGHVTRV